jgi:hypothetical protein
MLRYLGLSTWTLLSYVLIALLLGFLNTAPAADVY